MKKNEIDQLLNILLIFSVFLSAAGLLNDISNTQKYGGVDLRNRVVGARLLTNDEDPYHYKWKEGDSTLLLDPRDNPDWEVNRVTVPPTILAVHSLFSGMNYQIQRYLWLTIQWILFILSLLLFSLCTDSKINSKLIWICGLFFFGSSFFWRLHIERGQIYILYVFLIALSYWLLKKKNNVIWSGIVIGIAMSVRLPLMVISMPMLMFKRIKFISGNIIGFLISVGTSVILFSYDVWFDYFLAMKSHGLIHFDSQYVSSFRYPYQNIEGVPNLWKLAEIPIFDTSIRHLLRPFGINLTSRVLILMLITTIVLCIILCKKKFKLSGEYDSTILLGMALVFITDFFLPAARFSYNNVMLLPIIMLVIVNSKSIASGFLQNEC